MYEIRLTVPLPSSFSRDFTVFLQWRDGFDGGGVNEKLWLAAYIDLKLV